MNVLVYVQQCIREAMHTWLVCRAKSEVLVCEYTVGWSNAVVMKCWSVLLQESFRLLAP